MKASICVQSTRAATYSDAMAAIIADFPNVTEFEFIFLHGGEDDTLLEEIENDLATTMTQNKLYARANRAGRKTKVVNSIDKNIFRSSKIIDVSGISKELTAEIMAVAITTGKSVCTLSWADRNDRRKLVGEDNYKYFNTMKTPLIKKIFEIQRAVWIMFYTLSVILSAFVATYAISLLGYNIIPDKLINFLGVLVGIGGLFLSYTALRFVPNQRD
nr:hypothetical protein [uncultured Cohaesibacter sp.]